MKRRVFDVVAYITRRYGIDRSALVDPGGFRDELIDVGFEEDDVERALAWLDRLRRDGTGAGPWLVDPPRSVRVPTAEEAQKLSAEARGFVHRLEEAGVLGDAAREAVYERALSLDLSEVGIDEMRVLVALVLSAAPVADDALVARVLVGDLEGIYN